MTETTARRGRVETENSIRTLTDEVERELAAVLAGRLDLDDESLIAHGSDWWPVSKVWAIDGVPSSIPAAVARPTTTAEVEAILEICRRSKLPVTTSAGRSAVCGQAVPVAGGLVLDMTSMNKIVDLDEDALAITVEPGIFGNALETYLGDRGYSLGHFPQSIDISTVGGWIACRSAGQFSTRYGKIEDMLLGLSAVVPRPCEAQNRVTCRPTPAGALGIDLMRLFLGSEGTLGVITEATLAVHPLPAARKIAAFEFETFEAGIETIRRTLRRGARPACIRLYDKAESARHFEGSTGCALVVISEGEVEEVDWIMAVIRTEAIDSHRADDNWVEHWLATRNDVSALDDALAHGLVVDTIEVAAIWSDIPSTYHQVIDAVSAVPGTLMASAHCSHAYGTGACLYFTLAGAPPVDEKDNWYASMWSAAMDAARAAGATLSHHHGVGLVRAAELSAEAGVAGMAAFQAIKDALDPEGILNPGKMGLADRLGVGRPPWPPV